MYDTEYDLLTQFKRDGDDASRRSRAWERAKGLYGRYWVFAALTLLVNEVLKTLFPEPRPHFFQSCRLDWDKIDCTSADG